MKEKKVSLTWARDLDAKTNFVYSCQSILTMILGLTTQSRLVLSPWCSSCQSFRSAWGTVMHSPTQSGFLNQEFFSQLEVATLNPTHIHVFPYQCMNVRIDKHLF